MYTKTGVAAAGNEKLSDDIGALRQTEFHIQKIQFRS
jgi:hypothetical protein